MAISFNMVTPRLATGGGIDTREDVDALRLAGITDIIDCRETDDRSLLQYAPGLGYQWCPTEDDGNAKGIDWFMPGIAFGLAAISKPRRVVYAHCAAGVNRGPSMTYAILRALGWSASAAHILIVTARPQAMIRYANDADDAVRALGYV